MLNRVLVPHLRSDSGPIFDAAPNFHRYKFWSGHGVAGIDALLTNVKCFYITLLRNPLNYILPRHLWFNLYFRNEQKNIKQHIYNDKCSNEIVKCLGGGDLALAEDNLFSKYAWYGLAEYFEDSLCELIKFIPGMDSQQMVIEDVNEQIEFSSIPEVVRKELGLSQDAIDYFCERNKDDIILYEKALKELRKRTDIKASVQVGSVAVEILRKMINRKRDLIVERVGALRAAMAENAEVPLFLQDYYDANLHTFLHNLCSKDDFALFLKWLSVRLHEKPGFICHAFNCSLHTHPEDMKVYGEKLYAACEKVDPGNMVYRLVEARLHVVRALAERQVMPSPEFALRLELWLNNLRSIAPWQADALHALAMVRVSESRWVEAVELLQEAVKFKPEHLKMRADLCRALMHLGESGREEAELEARAALNGKNKPEWALRWLVVTLEAKDDLPGAAEVAKCALRKNPYWEEGRIILLKACQDTDSNTLESWLNNLRSIAPLPTDALHTLEYDVLYILASIRRNENRWVEVAELLREAVKFKPEHLGMRDDLCLALMHLGESGREEAEFEARAALNGQNKPEWGLRWLTLALDAKGDLPGATEAARYALRKNPYWGEAWRVLSVACQDTDPDTALSHAEKAAELSPGSFSCVFHYACLLRLRGEEGKAIAAAEAFLEQHPHCGKLHMFIAEIMEKQGQTDAAVEQAFKAVEADPAAAEIRIFMASLLIRCGRLDESETIARGALSEFPHEGWPHTVYSQVLEAKNDIAEAIAEASLACRKQSHKRSVSANYARLLRVNGELDECESFCRKALSEDDRQGWAYRELCRCADLRQDAKTALRYGARALEVCPEDMEFRKYFVYLQ
jgi:tetratricopeptide (TPR) repeat protein